MTLLSIETTGADEDKGVCEVQANTPDEIFNEIYDFMLDCPKLTNVSINASRHDIKSFVNNNEKSLPLGTTHDEVSGKTIFTLKK